MNEPKRIIISRTDGIGDVILTLPMCGMLKEKYPGVEILFLARNYTHAILSCCSNVDEIISWEEFENAASKGDFLKNYNAEVLIHVFPRKTIAYAALDAQIPLRIGTSHRVYHWITCNEKPNLGRKNSKLHEAQLNISLLEPLGIKPEPDSLHSYYSFTKIKPLKDELKALIDDGKFNLILHPKSHGSAREWSVYNFKKLIELLPPENFKIFITGSPDEAQVLKEWIETLPQHVVDLTGKLNLDQLISFISNSDGLVAASTGPLHIAAACGIYTCGLFAPIRPVHPDRWAPLGEKAEYLVIKKNCNDCENQPQTCKCIRSINPTEVSGKILKWHELKFAVQHPAAG